MGIRRRIAYLLLGPAITLIAGVIAGPLLSRLFLPADFGHYSMLMAVVGIVSVAVTLRLDNLIPTSMDYSASFWLVAICTSAGAVLCLPISVLLGLPWLQAVFVSYAVLATVIFNSFYYIKISEDRVLRAALARSIQSSGAIGGQVMLGMMSFGLGGLLVGELIGRTLAVSFISQKVESRSKGQLTACWHEQWDKARWLLPSAVLGAFSLQLLPLGMVPAVGATSAGIFMLAYRMVVIPNSLLAKVTSDSMLVELTRARKQEVSCERLVEQCCGRLFIAAVGIYGVLAVHGDWLFRLILGEKWHSAGELAVWLSVLVAGWSIASPMAAVFIAFNKTRWSLMLSLLDIANRLTALVIGWVTSDILFASKALAIGGVIVYGLSVISALSLSGASMLSIWTSFCRPVAALLALLAMSAFLLGVGFFWTALLCGGLVSVLALWLITYGK